MRASAFRQGSGGLARPYHIIRSMRPTSERFNLYNYFLAADRLEAIGGRSALEFRGERISYSQLRALVDHWAGELLARGVESGDRIALLSYDSPEFIACFLASVSIGAISVPMNTALSAGDLDYIVSDSGARLAVADQELRPRIGQRIEVIS